MRKAEKKKAEAKPKAKKLKINKQTVKDLDLDDPSAVKGGALNVTQKFTCGRDC